MKIYCLKALCDMPYLDNILYAGLSLVWPLPLRSTGSGHAGSAAMAHGPSRSVACGIFPDRGTNPCPLHRQADSQPLRHQGSPKISIFDLTVYLCENIDQVNTLQRKARCRGIYRRRHNYWSQQATSQQQQDRESLRSDAHVDIQARYAPYAIPSCHRRGNFQEQDETHVSKETEQKPPERRMERSRQDETLGSWFKIRIPFGIKYDEKWLLNLIQKQCSVPFTPVEFHYEKMQAQFFVENANIAFALKNVNGKIYNEANERISIFVDPCDAPHSVLKELRSEKVEQIKLPVKEQYDASQQSLDIQRVRSDPDLMTRDTGMARNPRTGVAASLQIHPGNMPKLLALDLSNKKPYQLHSLSNTMPNASNTKNLNLSNTEVESAGEMDKGERLEPEGMCADRNPLCTTFPDMSTNISSILELFPKLLTLDDQETSPLAKCGFEACKRLPTCKGSYFGSDELKNLVLQFLQQYYLIYDYGDRQGLAGAYHEEACFSLTIPFHPKDPAPSSLCEYFKDSRNMKKLKDPYLQVQLLKHTKRVIVHTLCVLPKTQHAFSSFVVDTWYQTETMLCFSVSGVFKEVEGSSQGCVHAFTRTFIATPAHYASLCIVNDELFVRDADPSETQSVFSIPLPTPTSSSMHPSPSSSRTSCRHPPPHLSPRAKFHM
ncbi:nuclear RNA export factor 3-like [Lagenorhynchus albirostris]|uniref:nuclear RNA export factor 3-like n=1 Tax=Lagenorhynchus albirostris TaxID=27610 RepID=UPI0028E38B45|nr:nuclear RNA export factor 3-like [Lagenorhynchus albirostris]